MKTRIVLQSLLLATLTGCGGGDVFVGVGGGDDFAEPTFISWTGNSNGNQVVDANNDVFAFYGDTGCLYNNRTGRENRDFCLTSPQGTVQYGGLRMRVVNSLSTAGSCITVLVEESTANFIDIGLDTLGREIVAVTSVRPAPCG